MKTNTNGILNPIKMNHSNSFILPGGEYTGNFNKNNEKIDMLQFDLETTKDTIIKLKSELISKNKEISNLKVNKDDKSLEHLYTLKVIATVLKLVDGEPSKETNTEQKNENENNNKNNSSNASNNNNANGNEKKEEQKEEKDNSNNNSNLNNISKKLPPISNRSEQSPKKGNRYNKELSYISSLKLQINGLKELLSKKDEEIKEIQKNKTTLNYSKLQNNFERNIAELSNIKKQNELMKTKIEDVTNLLFIEKEGNKSLKSKLQVFQSSFKDFQENSDKKNMDLEAKLVQAHEKERDCRIFHIRRASGPDLLGSRNSSKVNLDNDLDDNKRLKIAEEEIKNIKKNIENMNKDIKSKNDENEILKDNKIELEKKVNEMKERNNKFKNEINSMNKNVKDLKNNNNNLEKENKNLKNKFKTSNNDLTNEQNKIVKIKENLNKKENEILELKKQIEKLKQNNNFKDGMFFTSIGAKGKTKNDNLADVDVNIDEELAQIENKYKMINEQNKKNNEEKKIVEEEENASKKDKEIKEEEKVDNDNKNEIKDDLDKDKKEEEKI
jgi:chromosome segregation ATPase